MKRTDNQPAALDKQNPVGSGSQKLSQLLDQYEERANKATPGPWERDTCSVIARCGDVYGARKHVDGGYYGVICDSGDYDDCQSLDFIASSRTDVPKLVKALRELWDKYTDALCYKHGTPDGYREACNDAQDEIAAILGDRADVGEEKQNLEEPGA